MRSLYLVRHAQTRPTPGVLSSEWPLTPEGLAQARHLAETLPALQVPRVVTSTEPKAVETGRALADRWQVPLVQREGLQEHGRLSLGDVLTAETFQAGMERLFAHPSERVFGDESADAARSRLMQALNDMMEEGEGDELVVSHGTVISLLIARANGLDAYDLWRRVAMPDLLVLEWPSFRLVHHTFPKG